MLTAHRLFISNSKMKRFLFIILISAGAPLLVVLGLFIWTDPFKILHPFDINDTDTTNREYMSMELFKRNYEKYQYNSFVFCSSRGGGINTYVWKQYLPEDARPFLFQAWSESLTGMEQKMQYLCNHNIKMDNVLILFDIPTTFVKDQLPTAPLSVKHYELAGKPRWTYIATQFWNFSKKPSLWASSVKNQVKGVHVPYSADTVSNDWDATNRLTYDEMPEQDSLRQCTEQTRYTFFKSIETRNEIAVSEPIINEDFKKQLRHMKQIMDSCHSNYKILITPSCCCNGPTINSADLTFLQEIYGVENVFDYSGPNEVSMDYNNFSDPGHFCLRAGWIMMSEMYSK